MNFYTKNLLKNSKKLINLRAHFSTRILVLLLFVLFGFVLFAYFSLHQHIKLIKDPQKLAKLLIEQCSNAKYKPNCYENKIPLLMDSPTNLSMEQAFEVTTLIQKADQKKYPYCHVTGHLLSKKELAKNSSKWKEIITRCPMEGCANGCIHGVLMEKFSAERLDDTQLSELKTEVRSLCLENEFWKPTLMETIGCFHALGHASVYLTGADIGKSLYFCYEIGRRGSDYTFDFQCYQGVFMQIFQPLESEDKFLVQNLQPKNKNEVVEFCRKYDDVINTACLGQAWLFYFEDFKNPEKFEEYCGLFQNDFRAYCHTTVVNMLSAFIFDNDFLHKYCTGLKDLSAGDCLGRAARRMVQIDLNNIEKAINLCQQAENKASEVCFNWLIDTDKFIYPDPKSERINFCSNFPREVKSRCLNKSR